MKQWLKDQATFWGATAIELFWLLVCIGIGLLMGNTAEGAMWSGLAALVLTHLANERMRQWRIRRFVREAFGKDGAQ